MVQQVEELEGRYRLSEHAKKRLANLKGKIKKLDRGED